MIELGILGKISNQVGGILSDVERVRRINLFNYQDKDTLTGYYINSSNVIESIGAGQTRGWVTHFINVKPQTHYISNSTIASASQYIVFYDKNKTPISNMSLQAMVQGKGFVTPENCMYVRMTVNKNEPIEISEFQVELGYYMSPYKSYNFDVNEYENEQLNTHRDLLLLTPSLKGYISNNGVYTSAPSYNFRVTDYIRVSNDDLYVFGEEFNDLHAIILFDEEKNIISINGAKTFSENNYGFVRFAQNVAYIRITYNISAKRSRFKHVHGEGLANKWYVEETEYKSEKVNCYSFIRWKSALVIYALTDNKAIILDKTNERVIFTPDIDNIDNNKKIFEVSDFDGLESFNNINFAYIWRDDSNSQATGRQTYRIILLSENAIIYNAKYDFDDYNLSQVLFTKAKIWNALSDPMPQMVTNEQSAGKYALKILPNRIHYFNFLNSPVVYHGLSGDNELVFGSYTGSAIEGGVNNPRHCAPTCMFTTADGENFYVKYMFGFSGARYKRAGSETIYNYPRYKFGEDVNTSQFGVYGGGLKLKVRLNVVPSSANINPDHCFDYLDEIDITAATNAEQGVFTLSDASNVVVGDCVCITGTSTGEWSNLANTSYPINDGGNGIFFMVTEKEGNTIKLATCLGNPHNPLFCTHIHATNKAWNGVILSTGEEYPESWAVWVDTYRNNYPSYRLNSSELGISRSCGLVVNSDNTVLYAADTATGIYAENKEQVDGRTDKLILPPLGVWKFNLNDIDDHTKFELLLGNVFSVYNIQKINNAIYAGSQGGEAFVSLNGVDFIKVYDKGYGPICSRIGNIGSNVFFFYNQSKNSPIAIELK